MPYENQLASKAAHFDIAKNPDVMAFLSGCDYLKQPSEAEGQSLAQYFTNVPPLSDTQSLPQRIIAIDGSLHETSIDNHLPSTKVGYVKVSSVMIMLSQFEQLRTPDKQFVDPFKVATLKNNKDSLLFALPSANVIQKGRKSVRDSFRAAVDAYLFSEKTRFTTADAKTSLRSTLFQLASRRRDNLGTHDPNRLRLHKCPACNAPGIELIDIPGSQYCPACKEEVFPSDCLRLWEEVSDFQSNGQAMSRFMLQVEHIMPIHYLRYLMDNTPESVGSLAFFVDGPLAVFGQGAWLHGAIMAYLDEVRRKMAELQQPDLLIVGLQKTGQVVDYVNLIQRYIPNERLYAIEDDYRYKYILGRDESHNGFGDETYYGQDFIYKTASGRHFVFAIPYTVPTKSGQFHTEKTKLNHYPQLPRALALIHHFESDLYRNAVIPIALAHRYTAISLSPGGRVLDLLTRAALP